MKNNPYLVQGVISQNSISRSIRDKTTPSSKKTTNSKISKA